MHSDSKTWFCFTGSEMAAGDVGGGCDGDGGSGGGGGGG